MNGQSSAKNRIGEISRLAIYLLPVIFMAACGKGFTPSQVPSGASQNLTPSEQGPSDDTLLGSGEDATESKNPNMIATWDTHKDSAGWTQATIAAIRAEGQNLLSSPIGDIDLYCPPYPQFSDEEKIAFWLELVSAISQQESGLNPINKLVRTNLIDPQTGQHPVAQGLMQLSFETGKMYKCDFTTANDLNDPIKNLWCGVKILDTWIGHDHVISEDPLETVDKKKEKVWLGGARYWQTLRTPEILDRIKSATLHLPICAQK
jgi:hypothetical protein